jgi:hypothetical protein
MSEYGRQSMNMTTRRRLWPEQEPSDERIWAMTHTTDLDALKEACRYSDDFEEVENDPELGSVESLIAYKDALEDALTRALTPEPEQCDSCGSKVLTIRCDECSHEWVQP